MQKKVLTEQALYYGDVKMPEGFEINSLEFSKTIFDSLSKQKDFIFYRHKLP